MIEAPPVDTEAVRAATDEGDSPVLLGIPGPHGERFLPVLPILVFQQDRDGRSDGLAVAHAGDKMRGIALDLHSAAAAVALLPPPQFAIHRRRINRQACRHSRQDRDQRLAVGLSRCAVAEHVNDGLYLNRECRYDERALETATPARDVL